MSKHTEFLCNLAGHYADSDKSIDRETRAALLAAVNYIEDRDVLMELLLRVVYVRRGEYQNSGGICGPDVQAREQRDAYDDVAEDIIAMLDKAGGRR